MTQDQKKYLLTRTVFWAILFGIFAAAAAWMGDVTGLFHSGWMTTVIILLTGAYFPGFTGGIWRLYRNQEQDRK